MTVGVQPITGGERQQPLQNGHFAHWPANC